MTLTKNKTILIFYEICMKNVDYWMLYHFSL